ncbi:MAG: L-fucose isomerase, partial [Clostridia bacterium]|nr:L-fucose isomerase [Clostridia bacterium]
MAESRLIGGYPVIGIRPTIDGRRGPLKVRESLEDQTMAMAKAAQKLITENLKYSNGEPVEVIIADTTIGRVAEAAACAEKFRKAGVDITLTVTPCWCYGSETMDADPNTIKAVWGFNGTERPGAVYLASVLATHAQKGLPAFGIYGHDVQNLDEVTDMPADVQEKILRFARAAVAAATMRGKSYLQIGSICMGIGGSIIDSRFIEEYLGMRVESVDEVELIRRMTEEIYDKAEFEKALAWVKANAIEGFDKNPEDMQKSREEKDAQWEFVVKMMVIIKDLMNGNPNLPEGCEEEMVGHNAIAAGFQGQRQWTDFYPNCDFPEAMLNSSFDWNGAREPYILATENDVLNGLGMLFMKLLTNRPQMFADVRTYWSPEAVKRASGYDVEGVALENGGFIHLINSGACCVDANAEAKDENGNALIKEWYNVTEADQKAIMDNTTWNFADLGYFRGGGYSSRFVTKAEMPCTMIRLNLVQVLGPVLQIAEGWTVTLPDDVTYVLWKRTDYTWPCTWFAPRCDGKEG